MNILRYCRLLCAHISLKLAADNRKRRKGGNNHWGDILGWLEIIRSYYV
jgi:hypothetical protein